MVSVRLAAVVLDLFFQIGAGDARFDRGVRKSNFAVDVSNELAVVFCFDTDRGVNVTVRASDAFLESQYEGWTSEEKMGLSEGERFSL